MNIRKLTLLYICVCTMACSGCWDSRQLDNLGIVGAIGVDYAENGEDVIMTIQVLRPAGTSSPQNAGGDGKAPYWVIRGEGRTPFEALRNLTKLSSRRLFFPHTQCLLFGEDAARKGLSPFIDFFVRDEEIRPTLPVAVARGKASDLLNASGSFVDSPSFGFSTLLLDYGANSQAVYTEFIQLAKGMSNETGSPTMAVFETYTATRAASEEELSSAPLDPATPSSDDNALSYRLSNTAIFRDNQLVGELDEQGTRGYLWVTGKVRSGIIVIASPISGERVDVEILSAKSRAVPRVENGSIVIDVQVEVEGKLGGVSGSTDHSTSEGLRLVSDATNLVIVEEVEKSVAVAQQLGADIFDFAGLVEKKMPRFWKAVAEDWKSTYPTIAVNVTSDVTLRRYGVSSRPIARK